jgi:signal transduction histidine kinase
MMIGVGGPDPGEHPLNCQESLAMTASVRILLVEDDIRLSELIRDYLAQYGYTILAEFRGDTGRRRIVSENPDLVILDLMLPAVDRPDCRCSFHVDDPSCSAWFDAKHMGRAIGNLVQNALRCAHRRIHVCLERCDREAVIHVDDDGPGIPEKDRERIFEPFTRLDSSRSRISGGHGLGLAIVRQIAGWHRGSVTVLDSPMGGARFSIRWPGFDQRNGDDRNHRLEPG